MEIPIFRGPMKCLPRGMLALLNSYLIFNRGEPYSSGTMHISSGQSLFLRGDLKLNPNTWDQDKG